MAQNRFKEHRRLGLPRLTLLTGSSTVPVVRFYGAGIGGRHPARRLLAGVLVGAAILVSAGCSTGSPTPTGARSPVASPAPPAGVAPAGTPAPDESDDGPAAVVPTVQDLVDALLTERDMQVATDLREWTSIGWTGAGSAPGAVNENNEAPFFGCAAEGSTDTGYQPPWQAYTILGATEALPVTVTETLFAGQTSEVKEAFERLQGDLSATCLGPGASDDMWITSGEAFALPDLGDDRFALVHRMVLDSPEVTATAQWLTRFVVIQQDAVLAVIKVTELLPGQATGRTENDVIRIAEAAVAKLP